MCIITSKKNKVLGVFLIPGAESAVNVNTYFPYKGKLPSVGETFYAVQGSDAIWRRRDI